MGYIRLKKALSTFMYIVCSITVGRKDKSICRICVCSNMSNLLLILLPKGYNKQHFARYQAVFPSYSIMLELSMICSLLVSRALWLGNIAFIPDVHVASWKSGILLLRKMSRSNL